MAGASIGRLECLAEVAGRALDETDLDTAWLCFDAIRDEGLYRPRYASFEDYLAEQWALSARH